MPDNDLTVTLENAEVSDGAYSIQTNVIPGTVTVGGETVEPDLLDEIFSRFCIGK